MVTTERIKSKDIKLQRYAFNMLLRSMRMPNMATVQINVRPVVLATVQIGIRPRVAAI